MKTKMMFVMLLLVAFTKITAQNYNRRLVLQPGPEEGKDAMIFNRLGNFETNFGDHSQVIAQTWTWGGPFNEYSMRTLIDFDLSRIPSTAVIQSANLTFFGTSEDPGHQIASSGYSSDFELRFLDGNWDENTVTWQNQPSNRGINGAVSDSGPTAVDQDYTFWVWDYVNQKKNRTNSPTGLQVKISLEDRYRRVMFYSSDHTDPSKRPKLEIYYRVPGVPCPIPVTIQETICQGKIYTLNGISYSTSGTYKDTLTTREGCDSIVTVVLTVVPPDTLKQHASICEGDSYAFYNSMYHETGIYTTSAFEVNGCEVIHQLDLVKSPLPLKPMISLSDDLLYAEDGYHEYEWKLNDLIIEEATSRTFLPVADGSYQVVVEDQAGCVNVSDVFQYTVTGIEELKIATVKIFPNPAEDKLVVIVPAEWQDVELSIVTVTGVEIQRLAINKGEHHLSLEAVESGAYFLKIFSWNIQKNVLPFFKGK
jgi:hypothetical protein